MTCKLAVLDTNICLDLFVFHDLSSARLLKAMQENSIAAITCEDCQEEWRRVLDYPKLALTETAKKQSKSEFEHYIHPVQLEKHDYSFLPLCKDKDDQKFMELAYTAGAAYLFTKDKELLKLARKNKRLGLFHIMTPLQWAHSLTF